MISKNQQNNEEPKLSPPYIAMTAMICATLCFIAIIMCIAK